MILDRTVIYEVTEDPIIGGIRGKELDSFRDEDTAIRRAKEMVAEGKNVEVEWMREKIDRNGREILEVDVYYVGHPGGEA